MNKLLLISFDACSMQDLEYLKTLPNFKQFMQDGVLVENVDSIFLTNTYAVHTSITTGVQPYKHGIYDNSRLTYFEKKPRWNWEASLIKVPTLFTEAIKAEKHITNVFWPVCGKLPINNNLPEYLPTKNEPFIRGYLSQGNKKFMLKNLWKYGKRVRGPKEPELDDFSTNIIINNIIEEKPDLVTLHYTDVDTNKHYRGVNDPEIKLALRRLDERLGRLVKVCNEEYHIVVISDHGQYQTNQRIDLNDEIASLNLQDSVWAYQCSGSAFLKDLDPNKTNISKVLKHLEAKAYFGGYLNDEQFNNSGFNTKYDVGIYPNDDYFFNIKSKHHKASHGHPLGDKAYQVFYAMRSPLLKSNQVYQGGSLLNVTPWLAYYLDLANYGFEKTIDKTWLKEEINDN